MSERDTKEVLKDSIHNVASMGDHIADNVKVEYDEIDKETFSEVIENSDNVKEYKNIMPHVYQVLPAETKGFIVEKGVGLTFNGDENVIEFKFESFDGLNVGNVVDLAMEMGEVLEVN